jgi:hypothetical protein
VLKYWREVTAFAFTALAISAVASDIAKPRVDQSNVTLLIISLVIDVLLAMDFYKKWNINKEINLKINHNGHPENVYRKELNQNDRATTEIPAAPIFSIKQQYTVAFQRAVELAGAGRKVDAYYQLKGLEPTHPNEVNLLLWIAFTTSDQAEAAQMIVRSERLEPYNASVIQARQWLNDSD